jgi:hypothetical protein
MRQQKQLPVAGIGRLNKRIMKVEVLKKLTLEVGFPFYNEWTKNTLTDSTSSWHVVFLQTKNDYKRLL